MMHNGVALQGGTSHYFGDGWAKELRHYVHGRDNTLQHPTRPPGAFPPA